MNTNKKSEVIFIIISLLVLISIMCYFVFIKENKYTVIINMNDGISSTSKIEVNEGTTISSIKVPERNGYSFLYWTYEGKKLVSSSKVYKDMEIMAVWKSNK